MNHDTTIIRRLGAAGMAEAEGDLAAVLCECVEAGASVSFLLPIGIDKARAFWRQVAVGVARGERAVLVAEQDGRVVGTAQLVLAQPENQPHRADVAKVLVRPSARRRGIAARLMEAVDACAQAEGKTLLVLDTVTGGDAERLYERLGWTRVGVIPNYALMPDGRPCATTVFWKAIGGTLRA